MRLLTAGSSWRGGFGAPLILLFACLAPRSFAASDPAKPDITDPPQGVFIDEWYVLQFADQQAGSMHTFARRDADSIQTTETIRLSLNRAGQTIEIFAESTGTETVSGEPVGFEAATRLGAMETRSLGRVDAGKVRVRTTQFGQTTESEFDLPDTARMSWGVHLATMRHGFAPGTEYELDVYAPGQNPAATLPVRVEIIGPDTIELFGETMDAVKSVQTVDLGGVKLVSTSWSDKRGLLLRSDQNMMGIDIRVLRADRDRAEGRNAVSPELMVNTLIRPDRPIDRRTTEAVRYRLRLNSDDSSLSLPPATGMQEAVRNPDGSVDLLVRRQDHATLAARSGPPGSVPPDLAEYLASVPMINWKDPEILAMAELARGDETDAYRIASSLCEFVTDVIDEKSLDVGFASASEVARNKKGDCSEHGVLLAALGRACGIPSRVVAGLVYVDSFAGERGVFGFHMWTQMYIEGQWVDLDAAQRETDCNPTHIALAVSSMNEEAAFSLAAALLETIGQLRIEVLEVVPTSATGE